MKFCNDFMTKTKNPYDRRPIEQEVCKFDGCDEPVMDNPPCETCEIVSESLGLAQVNIIKHMKSNDYSKQEIRRFCNDSLEHLLKQVN